MGGAPWAGPEGEETKANSAGEPITSKLTSGKGDRGTGEDESTDCIDSNTSLPPED